jgi:predicted nucleic acid-binding Zn finger protein
VVAVAEGTVVAKTSGAFKVLGKFNSTRTPDIVYTVKEHLEIPAETGKRISCNCPGWRFSFKRWGRYTCKHTRYVEEHGCGETLVPIRAWQSKYEQSAVDKAKASRRISVKSVLARALDEAGVHLSDVAFGMLLRKLRPHVVVKSLDVRYPASVKEEVSDIASDEPTPTEVLRIITLD